MMHDRNLFLHKDKTEVPVDCMNTQITGAALK